MVDDSNLARIVHRLLAVQYQGDPTIEMIEVAVPNLRRMDELNRLRFDSWQYVASTLSGDQLELLTKIMIIAEREFNWSGGSVAAPIWLFRAYSKREPAYAHALANWALANRGPNSYIPFGRMIFEQSLSPFQVERELRPPREETPQERERRETNEKARRLAEKMRRAREAAERHNARKTASRLRHEELLRILEVLRGLHPRERLTYIINQVDLPLEFIPHNLIAESIPKVSALHSAMKQRLTARVGRRNRRIWRQLRIALDA